MTSIQGCARINKRFIDLKNEGRTGLVAFVTAGDPDFNTSLEIIKGLPKSGADIIEIGMPFSDPMADGPAIQASSLRALRSGTSLKTTLKIVREFRKHDNLTPVILMGYFNPIYQYGVNQFVIDSKGSGVDGFIIVDLPPEETEMQKPVAKHGMSLIYLVTPTTDDGRLPLIIEGASGFIYYVSITGVTGTATPTNDSIESALKNLGRYTELPIVVGFGISTKEKVHAIGQYADAVVVGSAFVKKISENLGDTNRDKKKCIDSVLGFVTELAGGLNE